MAYTSSADRDAIQNEMPWGDRDVPATMYDFITSVRNRFPDRPAVSFQIMSRR